MHIHISISAKSVRVYNHADRIECHCDDDGSENGFVEYYQSESSDDDTAMESSDDDSYTPTDDENDPIYTDTEPTDVEEESNDDDSDDDHTCEYHMNPPQDDNNTEDGDVCNYESESESCDAQIENDSDLEEGEIEVTSPKKPDSSDDDSDDSVDDDVSLYALITVCFNHGSNARVEQYIVNRNGLDISKLPSSAKLEDLDYRFYTLVRDSPCLSALIGMSSQYRLLVAMADAIPEGYARVPSFKNIGDFDQLPAIAETKTIVITI